MRLPDMIAPFRLLGPDDAQRLTGVLRTLFTALRQNPYTHFEDIEVTTPPTANATFAVRLKNLGSVPTGYVVIQKNKAGDLYTAPLGSGTAWSRDVLYLRCSVDSMTLTLRVT